MGNVPSLPLKNFIRRVTGLLDARSNGGIGMAGPFQGIQTLPTADKWLVCRRYYSGPGPAFLLVQYLG